MILTSSAKENIAKLPEMCFAKCLRTNTLIRIKAGESGYYKTEQPPLHILGDMTIDEYIDYRNERLGVTKIQREAMEVGSMFGWEIPGANVDNYELAVIAKK